MDNRPGGERIHASSYLLVTRGGYRTVPNTTGDDMAVTMAQPEHVDAQQAETMPPATSAVRGTPLGTRYELEREIGKGATGRGG